MMLSSLIPNSVMGDRCRGHLRLIRLGGLWGTRIGHEGEAGRKGQNERYEVYPKYMGCLGHY